MRKIKEVAGPLTVPARAARWAAACLCLCLASAPLAAARHAVRSADRGRYASAAVLGALPADETITVSLGLDWRDPAGLRAQLQGLYDPRSPSYRRFLSPQEFAARFAPSPQDYQALIGYAQANGLQVTATHANRLMVQAQGPAAAVEAAFGVRLQRYRRADGSLFRGPDADATVEGGAPVAQVSGLDDFDVPQKNSALADPGAAYSGSGSGGSYQGRDFRAAYGPDLPAALDGSGQTIALVEFVGYTPSDVSAYELQCGLPANAPLPRLVDGSDGLPIPGDAYYGLEVSLDIDVALAMAPAARIAVYEAPFGGSYTLHANDLLAALAEDQPLCRQVSCSWFGFGDSTTAALLDELAAQGQGFFLASGDQGAFVSGDSFPQPPAPGSLSPYITQVGGSTLSSFTVPGPPYLYYTGETTWNQYQYGGSGASGGGVCTGQLALPDYQAGVPMAANGGSTQWRNIPDVAMIAQGFSIVALNGRTSVVNGTSGSAPLWAAFIALVNQQAALRGQAPLGFANPALYAVGRSPQAAAAFHDIADGSTDQEHWGLGCFRATAGYDLCTGWGSPQGMALVNALLAQSATLGVSGLASLAGKPFVTFPNPVSASDGGFMLLRFAPAASAHVDLYDEAQRRVAGVDLDPAQAAAGLGRLRVRDDGGHPLAPGAYIAVLKAGGGLERCKLTVLP
jgi:subtilase family serine protease